MKKDNYTVTVASGKGGTGKTTVATNLALSLARAGRKVQLLDCDVEEPNCHIFLKPVIEKTIPLALPTPVVDESKCTGCGECGRFCQFSAIAIIKKKALVFPELCHSCGGCWLVCPEQAMTPEDREFGVVEIGKAGELGFVHGRMRVGQAASPPLIRKVKEYIDEGTLTFIDASPGTSCPVVEAVRTSDFVILVTEPTPFGLNDLKLAVEMTREIGVPRGVVVNRLGIGDNRTREYCLGEDIPILAEIPDDRRVAEAYSKGTMIIDALPEYRSIFLRLATRIQEELHNRQLTVSKQQEPTK